MKKHFLPVVIMSFTLGSAFALAQDGALGGVRDLFAAGRYAEAQDQLDAAAGDEPSLNWWRARLATSPDRFQELALMVGQDARTPEQQKREVVLARAREHFAAGRYQSAEGLLRPYAEARDPLDAAARLWWGMSLQATGEARAAAQALSSIPEEADEFGFAQALLADLNLRAQRPRRAREHAQAALDTDPTVGAIALSVLEQLARAEGDVDAARAATDRLASDYPRSVELVWARSAIPSVDTTADEEGTIVAEDSSARRTFALQYGAFRDRGLALRRIRQLESSVSDLRLEVDRAESPPLYRVVGGSFGSRSQVERARDSLAERGIEAFILAPDH